MEKITYRRPLVLMGARQALQDGSTLLNLPLFGVSALRAECSAILG